MVMGCRQDRTLAGGERGPLAILELRSIRAKICLEVTPVSLGSPERLAIWEVQSLHSVLTTAVHPSATS